MKKSLVVGALASTLVLSATPVVVPALGMSAFAAETVTNVPTVAERETLLEEVETKFPDVDTWGAVAVNMDVFENSYGCSGKGCTAEEAGILVRGEKNDIIADALTAAGVDTSKMTDVEKLSAAKNIAKYTSDAEFKATIDGIEAEIKMILLGLDEPSNNGGDMTPLAEMLVKIPNGLSAEAIKGKTIYEIIAQIKNIPGYKEYSALGRAYFQLKYWVNDSESTPEEYRTTPEQIKEYYDMLVSDFAAAEAYEEKQATSTPEKAETINELQKFVDETKKDETYQKYERLVNAVRYAEYLLEIAQNPENYGGKGGDEATPVVLAEEAPAYDFSKDFAEAIKAVGDAMRALGIKTDLGENLTSATAEDLSAALGQAKKVEKFEQYKELVEAVEAAEIALEYGATDATELKKILEAVKAAAAKVLPPDTGVAMNSAIDADAAIETTSSLVVLTTVAILTGAAVITKRSLARKNR